MSASLFAFLEQEGELLVHQISSGFKLVFNYLKEEAQRVWEWVKTTAQSPQVQSLVAKALADAEAAAAALIQQYGDALQPVIKAAVEDVQTFIANFLNSALGGNVKAALAIPAAQDSAAQLGNAASLIVQQAFGLVIAKLAVAA